MFRFGKLHKKISFALSCLPHGDDERFVAAVKRIGQEHNLVSMERYGERVFEEILYFIDMEDAGTGFFAQYNNLLAFLYFADYHGLTPVVRFHENFPYAEKEAVNGSKNPFEYYFLQPAGIALSDVLHAKTVLKSKKENSYLARDLSDAGSPYQRSDAYINEMARIEAQYVRLNNVTKIKINDDIRNLLEGKRTLGVHMRGTDFKHNYNGHPVALGEKELLEQALCLMDNGYEQLFLATDSTEAIKVFHDKLGKKLRFFPDVVRSSDEESVMNSRLNRKDHHYLLGLEVLRDMYALAACEGLLAGLSQVVSAARIHKRSVGGEYKDLVIMDKGINVHGQNCPKVK